MMTGCPGAAGIKGAPSLKIKTCPQCGGEIELFSNETQTPCTKCGFVAYNDTMGCVNWCKYAKDCVGEALYSRIMEDLEKQRQQQQEQQKTG